MSRNEKKGDRRNGGPGSLDLADLLPAHVDAERFVLGVIVLNGNDSYLSASAILDIEDFSLDKHQKIFRRMGEVVERGEPLDRVTLANELIRHGELDACDGFSYIVALDEGLPHITNIDSYARIVADKSSLRKIVYAGRGAISRAITISAEPDKVLSTVGQEFMNLSVDRTHAANGSQSVSNIIENYPGGLNGLCGAGLKAQGVQTGFTKLDDLTGGFQPGELIVIAGRPSMGKTAICLDIARHVGGAHLKDPSREPQGVAIFSLEMTKESLLIRMICQEARINSYAFRADVLSRADREKVALAASRLQQMPLYIDDRVGLTVPDIHVGIKRQSAAGPPVRLAIVDYLGLVCSVERVENRALEIGYITKGLKRIAKDLRIPVVLLAQLSRACEARADKRPILSDLRESGEIEQDADLAGFLFRPEVYKPDREDLHGVAELLVLKQRNGPLGKIELVYIPSITRFENRAEDCDLPRSSGRYGARE